MDTVDIGALVNDAARRYGVDPKLANAVVEMESKGNPNAYSGKAIGVMQLTPSTAREMGVKDPWDPAQNIDGGMKYLAQLNARYNNNPRLVLAAYNAGPGAVHQYGGVPPYPETQNYVRTGLGMLGSRLLDRPPAGGSPSEPGVSSGPQPALGIAEFHPGVEPPQQASAPLGIAEFQPGTEAPEEPSSLQKVGTAFWQGIGGPTLVDIGKGVAGYATGDEAAVQKGFEAAHNVVQGFAQEPGRIRRELEGTVQGFREGDPGAIAYHAAGAIPMFGSGVQQVADDVARGDYDAAAGHTGAIIAPFVAGPALGAVGRGAEATSRAAAATEAGIRAGVADVTAGAAKTAAGGAAAAIVPGPAKWFAAEYLTRPGRAQMLSGIRKGVAAAREALTPTVEATAPAEEAAPAGAGAAEPAPPPPAPEPPKTPGQVYAESQGYNWAEVSPGDRQILEQVARAQENVRAQTPPPEAVPPQAPPPAAPAAAAPEPPSTPPPVAPAAPQTPQSIAQALRAEMEQSGTVTPPEPQPAPPPPEPQPSFAETARAKKVDALFDVMTRNKIPLSMVEQFGPKEWDMLARYAGVNPPSETSIGQLKQRLADYEQARNIPVNPATTPAEAQTAFEQARAARAARRRPPPIR